MASSAANDLLAWTRDARRAAIDALFVMDSAPHKALASALCATDREDVRLDLASAFGRLNADAFVVAVCVCLVRGDAHVVSLVARQVVERHPALDPATQDVLVERLVAARARFVSPLVTETIDEALLSSSSPAAFADLVARLASLSPRAGAKVIVRLLHLPDEALESMASGVVDAAVNNRRLYLGAARLLVRICSLIGARRARLFHTGVAILADDAVTLSDRLVALSVVDAAFAWPIAVDIDVFLQLFEVAVGEPRLTVLRILGRLGTEDAATALVRLSGSAEPEVATAAQEALASWVSPLVDVKRTDDASGWLIVPTYSDDAGIPLVLAAHSIRQQSSTQQYALDDRGLVVPIGSSDEACTCCERPRLWVVRAARFVCPRTKQVRPSSSSSLSASAASLSGAPVDAPPRLPSTLSPGVAATAALRVVEFIDQGQRWGGVVIADDGARCAVLTSISSRFHWYRDAPTALPVVIGGREATARLVHYDTPLALYEVDVSVPGLAGTVGIRAPTRGLPAFVVRRRGGVDWGRLGLPVLGGSLFSVEDFASRPSIGTPVFDEAGTLVALWERSGGGDDIGVGVTLLWSLQARGIMVLGQPWPTPST